jgi:hypothetical protein
MRSPEEAVPADEGRACPIWSQVLSADAPLAEKTHEALTLALLARAGKHYDLMVDSTKTASGHASAPFRLRRALGKDFLLVHLVRDPRAVAWSAIKKTERRQMTVNRPLYCTRVALPGPPPIACEAFDGLYRNISGTAMRISSPRRARLWSEFSNACPLARSGTRRRWASPTPAISFMAIGCAGSLSRWRT